MMGWATTMNSKNSKSKGNNNNNNNAAATIAAEIEAEKEKQRLQRMEPLTRKIKRPISPMDIDYHGNTTIESL